MQNVLRVMTARWFLEINYLLINPKGNGTYGICKMLEIMSSVSILASIFFYTYTPAPMQNVGQFAFSYIEDGLPGKLSGSCWIASIVTGGTAVD